jgi:hypothetical protein
VPPFSRRTAILLFFIALLPACNRTPQAALDPESAANAFFATLENGDAQTAYNNAAFGFQAAQSYDGFLSNARALGIIGGKPPTWTGKQLKADEADLDGSLVNHDGQPVTLAITLTKDGEAWKIFTLKTAAGMQEAENHFSIVGRETGFNDVYHQPMPDPAHLADMVHQTLLKFNDAVIEGSFHSFYLSVSQQWKDGERLSGAAASGVTEKILQNHFQGFIDHKVNIAAVANLQPVFDTPPLITEDGLLELKGHFNTQPYRLNFDLDYIYELPFWKLFGIDVNLTE